VKQLRLSPRGGCADPAAATAYSKRAIHRHRSANLAQFHRDGAVSRIGTLESASIESYLRFAFTFSYTALIVTRWRPNAKRFNRRVRNDTESLLKSSVWEE
jgi:hypothetical protein